MLANEKLGFELMSVKQSCVIENTPIAPISNANDELSPA